MKKKTWDLYAPIYKRAMKADQKVYDYMYARIPEVIRDKEVLEITPDKMGQVMTDVLKSRLLCTVFGMTDLNRRPKKWEQDMRAYEAWYKKHGDDYPINWVVNFDETVHQDGSYYYFTRCPICEFCQREGIAELMPALCATDEVMFRLQHGKLHREHTIANGDPVCDYWVVGDKVKEAH